MLSVSVRVSSTSKPRRVEAGDPEVGDDCANPRRCGNQDDVRALEVGVDDAGAVSGVQAFGELHGNRKRLFPLETSGPDSAQECLALEQFHSEEEQRPFRSPCGLVDIGSWRHREADTDFINPAHVRMGHLAGKRDFLLEALHERLVLNQVSPQCLERDGLLEEKVMGFVDFAHPAAAKKPRDAIPFGDDVTRGQAGPLGGRLSAATGHRLALVDSTFDFCAQIGVVRTLAVQEGSEFLQRQVEGGVNERGDTCVAIEDHSDLPPK